MIKLDNTKFCYGSIGALLVIAGVVLKNSLEQLDMEDGKNLESAGMISFIIGWLIIAYAISLDKSGRLSANPKTLIVFMSALGIVIAVMQMKKFMGEKKTPPMVYPAVFVIAWLVLGYMAGSNFSMSMLGVFAAVLVLISMMLALPWQRKNCIVDGPGLPLFVIGWVVLIFVNATR